MKPVFEDNGRGHVTLNLTKPFLGWSAVFVILAVLFDSSTLLWVAALPWLAMVVFAVGVVVFAGIVMGHWYLSGKPITKTDRHGNKTIIQRKR